MAAQERAQQNAAGMHTPPCDTPIVVKLRQIGKPSDSSVHIEAGSKQTSVHDLKAIIQQKLAIPAAEQKLLFLGKLLQPDAAACSDFGIFHNCVIHLLQSR